MRFVPNWNGVFHCSTNSSTPSYSDHSERLELVSEDLGKHLVCILGTACLQSLLLVFELESALVKVEL